MNRYNDDKTFLPVIFLASLVITLGFLALVSKVVMGIFG
jgi:hypothetical protein